MFKTTLYKLRRDLYKASTLLVYLFRLNSGEESEGRIVNSNDVNKIGQAFGTAVKLKRIEVGINQEELAYRAGLARSFVSGVERGVVKASTFSVWKISTALHCQPSDIWKKAENLYLNQKALSHEESNSDC